MKEHDLLILEKPGEAAAQSWGVGANWLVVILALLSVLVRSE